MRAPPVSTDTPVPRKAASPGLAALKLFSAQPVGYRRARDPAGPRLRGLAGPSLYGVDPFEIVGAPFQPPGGDPILGTDYLGQDLLAGLLQGGRATLLVGLSSALMTVVIGVAFGRSPASSAAPSMRG